MKLAFADTFYVFGSIFVPHLAKFRESVLGIRGSEREADFNRRQIQQLQESSAEGCKPRALSRSPLPDTISSSSHEIFQKVIAKQQKTNWTNLVKLIRRIVHRGNDNGILKELFRLRASDSEDMEVVMEEVSLNISASYPRFKTKDFYLTTKEILVIYCLRC